MNNIEIIWSLIIWFFWAAFALVIIGLICDIVAYIRTKRKEKRRNEKICSAYRPNTKR